MIGLRDRVGCDWGTYEDLFQYSRFVSFSDGVASSDPAFGALNWIAGALGLGLWAVNLVCAIIFTAGLVGFCRWQPNPPLAMLVAVPYLVIVVAMGYTRQSAALGFIMIGLTQYHKGSWVGVVTSLILATLFHKASILIFPLFGLGFSRNFLFAAIGIGLVTYVLYDKLVAASLSHMMFGYIDQEYSASGATVRIAMNVVPALLFLGFRNRFGLSQVDRRIWVMFSIASCAALVLLYLSPSSAAVDRAALFLIPLQVFVLSRIPSAFPSRGHQNLLLVGAVIAYSLAVEIVWLNFGQFSLCWVPYRSYLWS